MQIYILHFAFYNLTYYRPINGAGCQELILYTLYFIL